MSNEKKVITSKVLNLNEFRKTNECKEILNSKALIKNDDDCLYFLSDDDKPFSDYENCLIYAFNDCMTNTTIYTPMYYFVIVIFDADGKPSSSSTKTTTATPLSEIKVLAVEAHDILDKVIPPTDDTQEVFTLLEKILDVIRDEKDTCKDCGVYGATLYNYKGAWICHDCVKDRERSK